jgi:hypothetical protein
MTPLPPYSGDTTCPKCRGSRVESSYRPHPPVRITWSDAGLTETAVHGYTPAGGECLLRTCRDCGWAWLEACADAEPDRTPQDFYDRIGATPCGTYTLTAPDGTKSNPIPYGAPDMWAPEHWPNDDTVMRGRDAVGP